MTPPSRDSIDPIFAAIEDHRIADAALVRAKGDNELDRCGDLSWERYKALLATTPTSQAGCAALLRYIDEHEANYGVGLFGEYDDPAKSAGKRLLSRIAAALESA